MASLQMQVASEMAHNTKRLSLISTRARIMCFALLASMFFWVSTIREHVMFTAKKKTLMNKKANLRGILHRDRVIRQLILDQCRAYTTDTANAIYRIIVKQR